MLIVSASIGAGHDGAAAELHTWVQVHAGGADVALLLAGVAAAYAFVRLRARKDLWLGGAALLDW